MREKAKAHSSDRPTQAGNSQEGNDSAWLPAWAPYLVFALLSLFLFREFIVSSGLLFGTDVLALGYYARHWYAEMVANAHVFPLWNPNIFAGLPFVDAMHGDIFYPTTFLKFLMPVHRAMGWKLVLHVFLAGVFAYAWLRHLKIGRAISTWGGVAYMLAPVMVSLVYPGHDGKLFVTALTPLALWATDWSITRGGVWRFAILSLVVALLILTAHMMLAYFTTWAMAALAVFRLAQRWRQGRPKLELAQRLAAFAAAGIVGGLFIGAVQIWTPLRYLRTYSQRVEKTTEAETEKGYAYSTSWSLHPEEAFSLLVPEFVGANIGQASPPIQTYWGRNPFKLNHEYAGLIALLLLPLAFINRRRRAEAWLFTGLAVAALVYALGATTPLFRLYYWLIPGVKLFRGPSSIMYLFAIAVVSGAALGLEGVRKRDVRDDAERKVSRYLWAATGVFLLLAVLGSAGVFTELWVSVLYRDIAPAKAAALQANLPGIQKGLWLAFVLSGLLAGMWHLRSRAAVPEAAWVGALVLLTAFDLARVDSQFLYVVNPSNIYPRDDTTDFLLNRQAEAPPFRVLRLPNARYGLNHFAFYGIEQAAGHHGNELGRYRDLTEGRRLFAPKILQLLNVRYLVSGAPLEGLGLPESYRGRAAVVYELPGSLPRAFLVSSYEVLPDSLALPRLLDPEFDPTRAVILDREPDLAPRPGTTGRVEWRDHGVNSRSLTVESDGPALLVISENYYPAWRASIDGKAATVLRGDYSLRALAVPAGTHEIRFEYRSALFRAAIWVTLVSAILTAAVAIVGLRVSRGRRAATELAGRA